MNYKPECDKVIGWLEKLPDARLAVDRIGSEIVRAYVIWDGMPIREYDDPPLEEDYSVNPGAVRRLMRDELIRNDYKRPGGSQERVGFRYVYRTNYTIRRPAPPAESETRRGE